MYLRKEDIPQVFLKAFPGYKGKKFQFQAKEKMELSGAYWSGGTKYDYVRLVIATGQVVSAAGLDSPGCFGGIPENNRVVAIPPGNCIAQHCMFQGTDLGITFYLNPADYSQLFAALPSRAELTSEEKDVLDIICGLKSFARVDEARRRGIHPEGYALIVEDLKAKGLLDKRGAATIEGKNVRRENRGW